VTGPHETPRPWDEKLARRSGAVTPSRSAVQRLEALRRANEIRIGRARLKRELVGGGRHGARGYGDSSRSSE
jgi:hypothetical protein